MVKGRLDMQGHNRNWVRLARVGKGAALSQAIGAESRLSVCSD